jgi:acyl transferase domain-containing protein/acyl carrier protein
MASQGPQQVAIIGLACRFPGARNSTEFWENLRQGVESISFFSADELQRAGVPAEVRQRPNYVPAKAVLDDADMFDYEFFGLTPREAELMDPQQRLFLECAWEALENAGYDFQERDGRVGVYGGAAMSTWLFANVLSRPDLLETTGGLQLRLANGNDFLTTQVSYRLNLKGPSITVQTACSTALTAVHIACQAVLNAECDLALAGGVAISFPLKSGYLFHEGGIWSPDGHCRPFDANSQGTVEGNGAGIVVLKRLEDALADHDCIHAVIRGSAINNDGALKIGYTAPSVETQTQVVVEALSMAQAHPETIGYVEAHGSGTPLGDPIEVRALTQAFRTSSGKKTLCYLGSVKSNLGHLDNAAGIASLIKTVESLKHGQVPPTLHFRQANPQLELDKSPFVVNATVQDWPRTSTPRRAGVSSLGIGGTNVHMVLEEAPARAAIHIKEAERWKVLPLSARTPAALNTAKANLAAHLRANPQLSLSDVAYSLSVGRRQFGCRYVVVAETVEQAALALSGADRTQEAAGEHRVAFLFPGLGDHYAGMAAGLFEAEPGFRRRMDECAEILKSYLNIDIRQVLFSAEALASAAAAPAGANRLQMMLGRAESPLTGPLAHTSVAQPAIFAIEYALAGVLSDWGIQPEAMLGYSLGEYVAACVAGVFSLYDALRLVAVRATMIESLPQGAMLAVPVSEEELRGSLDGQLSISISAGPALTVVAGPVDAAANLEAALASKGVVSRRMAASRAFHSAMMDPIIESFAREVAQVPLKPPRIPYLSNVTGAWITPEDATDPYYWARHMRQTVRFADGVEKLLAKPGRIFLEVGPGQALSILVRQHPVAGHATAVIASMRDRYEATDDSLYLRTAIGRAWVAGAKVNWAAHAALNPRQRVPLPTYPFERRRCWIEPGQGSALSPSASARALHEPAPNVADWFYLPAWREAPLLDSGLFKDAEAKWLIFQDEAGLGSQLAEILQANGNRVCSVEAGAGFHRENEHRYVIHPGDNLDYKALLHELQDGQRPLRVVHLWCVNGDERYSAGLGSQAKYFYSLLYLAQAIGELGTTTPVRIDVVSNFIHDVTGEGQIHPEKAAVLGPVRVIPQEYANIRCRNIDFGPVATSNAAVAAGRLAQELFCEEREWVARRGPRRWTRSWQRAPLRPPQKMLPRLRHNGVYLIAGGMEGSGLAIAEHLARTVTARLVLTGPPNFPPRDKWERWLQSHDDRDDVSRNIRRLRSLELAGCDMVTAVADVASESSMRDLVEQALRRFGSIHGVIHAAGAPGAGLIQLKTAEMADAVLAPKIAGTMVLERLTQDLSLDFFLLFSSLVSLAGGLGQVDTCAAGAFQESFAHWRARQSASFTGVINWSPFQWDSWQLPTVPGAAAMQSQIQSTLQTSAMDQQQAAEAFGRILSAAFTQVAVCRHDLETVIEQTNELTASKLIETMDAARSQEQHRRPDLETAYHAPRNRTEEIVASVWAGSFGLEKVGVHDNFFDLAGNSLLAMQIVTRLRSALGLDVPMTALFESPTVAGLAQRMDALRPNPEPQSGDDLEALLKEVELLSPEDAQARLVEERGLEGQD